MANRIKLERVLEPINIGSVRLKNRMIRMGAQRNIRNDGVPDTVLWQPWVDYYEALARGGFGMISYGGGSIGYDKEGKILKNNIITDFELSDLKRMARVLHDNGCAAFLQYCLSMPASSVIQLGFVSYASSELSQEDLDALIPHMIPTKALTKLQIGDIIQSFADGAARLREAGFDGIEINAGHTHGLNSFLSPAWNKRTDEYGGPIENRCRILCEINREIKARCGEDFAIFNNFSGCEFNLDGGQRVSDVVAMAPILEASGADALHVRYEVYHESVPDLAIPRSAHECPDIDLYPQFLDKDLSEYGIDNRFGNGIAAWSGVAAKVKQVVSIPVSVSGRIDAFVGEQLINEGKLDLVNICRRAIADHDYCAKIISGDYEDIRPCTGCFTCYDGVSRGLVQQCMVNPALFKGADYMRIDPAPVKKRVLVVGSGAAGLESARVAALRGHDVILCEKEKNLGGSLPLAGMITDFHIDFLGLSKWLIRQVEKLGVDIRCKTVVDREFVENISPDAIVVAVGAGENVPNILGIDKRTVMTSEELHNQLRTATKFFSVESLSKLSKTFLPLGKKIAVIGGGIHGLQTARFLMQRGREVVILEEGDELGKGMLDCGPKLNMLRWLTAEGVEMHKGIKIKEITDGGVVFVDKKGEEALVSADNVVTVLPMKNNLSLYEELRDLAPTVYAVGDCNPKEFDDSTFPPLKLEPVGTAPMWPRFTAPAISEAYRLAREL